MRGPKRRLGLAAALLLVAVLSGIYASGVVAQKAPVFATRIGGGPISLSCDTKGPLANRVTVDVGVGYSDVREGLDRRLAGRRGSGSLRLALRTDNGHLLARDSDREGVRFGVPGNRIHQNQQLVLDRKASAQVLRYAQGSTKCDPTPGRTEVVKVAIEARERLGASGAAAAETPPTPLSGSGEVVGLPGAQATACAPYPCYTKAAEVLAWRDSDVRPVDVANVPLAKRVLVPGPRLMTGFDNGPWAYWSGSDLRSQGSTTTGNVFNFSQWQYVDTLYYYSHYLLSVPPTVWVNAAHRNGVSVLGSVTGDCKGCGPELNDLFENHTPAAVDTLYRLAATYGFDGWMIDIEEGARYSPQLLEAMEELRGRRLPDGRPLQIATYEAHRQSLDDTLLKPFLAAGEWQADYSSISPSGYPKQTYDFLGKQQPPLQGRRYDTYWATYVYSPYERPAQECNRQSGPNYIWNGFACNNVNALFANLRSARASSDPPGFWQSLALFAPGWTAFGGRKGPAEQPAPRSVSQDAETRFWSGVGGYLEKNGSCNLAAPNQNSVSALLTPRSTLTAIPFHTNFDTGEGDGFAVQGSTVAKRGWNLLSSQDAQPTEFCAQSGELGAAIDYEASYDGGSSLEVRGRTTAGAQRIYLYEAAAPLPAQPVFTLRYLTGSSEPWVSVWIDDKGPYDLEPTNRRAEGLWTVTEAVPSGSLPRGTMTRIGLRFGVAASVRTKVGEIAVFERGSTPPALISPSLSAGQLIWTAPAQATQYYNVWAHGPQATCLSFLGRTTLPRYELAASLFPAPAQVGRYLVQAVSTAGLWAPLTAPPCVA